MLPPPLRGRVAILFGTSFVQNFFEARGVIETTEPTWERES